MEILEVEDGPPPEVAANEEETIPVGSKEDQITLRMKIFQLLDNPASSRGVRSNFFKISHDNPRRPYMRFLYLL
jgi:hypothetical protein